MSHDKSPRPRRHPTWRLGLPRAGGPLTPIPLTGHDVSTEIASNQHTHPDIQQMVKLLQLCIHIYTSATLSGTACTTITPLWLGAITNAAPTSPIVFRTISIS